MKNTKYAILLIAFLGLFLRFNQLNTLPALNADEAAIGYNAYSLLQTGKDEHGNPWPIHFQSFNDYKPGLYFYLVMPFIAVMGLTEWAVRIPGAMLGVGTILLVWLLARELFPNKRWLPELSALFLAISPWHIHFSRGGWEVNVATFFITLGVLFFVRSLKNASGMYASAVSFVAAIYTYHASRVVVPLLVACLFFRYHNSLIRSKHAWVAALLGICLVIPLGRDFLGGAGVSRASGVGLFADLGPYNKTNQQRGEHENPSGFSARFFHNKVVNYGIAFAENYGKHFSGDFLFISGDDIERDRVPEFGQLFLFDILFLCIGLAAIAKKPRGWFPLLLWLMVAPVASALTFQSPHALRAENMVIPIVIISAYGASTILGAIWKMPSSRKKIIYTMVLFVFVCWDVSRYIHQYYFHMAKTYDFSSQYGAKDLVAYIRENQNKYEHIVVTNRYDQPYILFLFYLRYPPDKFQQEHSLTAKDQFGFSTVKQFGIYTFTEIQPWDTIRTTYKNSLVAGTGEEIPPGTNVVKTVPFPSGRAAFKVVAN